MPNIDTRSTQESNFRIEKTHNNTYAVRSDSERFGKNEITYESPNREDCLNYIAQRRPERQIRFYVIPDLMTWATNAHPQTPIEKYDSLQEAVARFQELFAQPYNAEATDLNSVGLPYARLTLGMEWSENGKRPGAIDLIHVRKEQRRNSVVKDLCDDFTRVESFNTDRRLMAMLRQLEHEIGFDRLVLNGGNKTTTMPYYLWENEYFESIGSTEAILESRNAFVIVSLQPDYAVDYEIYDNATAELLGSGRLPRTDYLSFEEAARAALGEPGATLTRQDIHVQETLLEAHETFPKKRAEPVYLKSWEEAVRLKEQPLYNESRSLNTELMEEMARQIRANYNGLHLDSRVARGLLAEFGAQRTAAMLANVIQHRPWEGRFSPSNRRWAEGMTLPQDPAWDRLSRCDTHPGLLNELVTDVRQEIRAQAQEQVQQQDRTQQQEQAKPSRLADRLKSAGKTAEQRNQTPQQGQRRTQSRKNDLQL